MIGSTIHHVQVEKPGIFLDFLFYTHAHVIANNTQSYLLDTGMCY